MKTSSEQDKNKTQLYPFQAQKPDLELPVDPDFVSKPVHIDPQLMYQRCVEMLPYRTSKPDFEANRLRDKINVEFVL